MAPKVRTPRDHYEIADEVADARSALAVALRTLDAERASFAAAKLVEAKKADQIRKALAVLTTAGIKVDGS